MQLTVQELITLLSKQNQNAKVVAGFLPATGVTTYGTNVLITTNEN